MNFTSFEYFAVLMHSSSLRDAAQTLNISQQALSAQIHRLEQELNVPLITNGRPASLTAYGECFGEYAQKMLRMRREFLQKLAEMTGQKRELHISIPAAGAPPFLQDALLAFSTMEPECMVRLEERPEDMSMFNFGRFDFHLSNQKFHPELEYLKIQSFNQQRLDDPTDRTMSNVISVVIRKDFLQRCWGNHYQENLRLLEEEFDLTPLKNIPFIRAENVEEVISHYLSEKGFVPKVVMVTSNPDTCFNMCLSGLGAEIAPDGWVLKKMENCNQEMVLIRLDQVYPSSDYYLGYTAGKTLNQQEEAFIRCVCSVSQMHPSEFLHQAVTE